MTKKQQKEPSDLEQLTYSFPTRLERLWGEVKTPLFWSVGAVISLGFLVAFSVTPDGGAKLAQLPYEAQDLMEKKAPGTSLAQMLDKRLGNFKEENLALAMDRAKLEMRVAQLEQSYGDITASIPIQPVAISSPPAVDTSNPNGKADIPIISPGTDVMTGKGAVTLTTRSQFGADLGPAASLNEVRARWIKLMEKFGSIMTGYEPVITAQDSARGVELRLVIGPFANVTEAANLCARLQAAGLNGCSPAPYDGQRLALR